MQWAGTLVRTQSVERHLVVNFRLSYPTNVIRDILRIPFLAFRNRHPRATLYVYVCVCLYVHSYGQQRIMTVCMHLTVLQWFPLLHTNHQPRSVCISSARAL